MKTSNKILLIAFIVIVVFMVIANTLLKNKVEEIKSKQNSTIHKTDTIQTDSISKTIKIQIN